MNIAPLESWNFPLVVINLMLRNTEYLRRHLDLRESLKVELADDIQL